MEASAIVDLVLDDYPDVKFWVSFQCKVEQNEFLTNDCDSLILVLDFICKPGFEAKLKVRKK